MNVERIPEKTEIKVIEEEKIILTLNQDEASMILALAGRLHMDYNDLYTALRVAGVEHKYKVITHTGEVVSTLRFQEAPNYMY